MKYYITGTKRGLGKALAQKYCCVDSIEECDVFINCKQDRFDQVFMLYKASELGKRIINISSNSADDSRSTHPMYAVYKSALDDLNSRLYYKGISTTSIRFGYFDSERVKHINKSKMSLEYCVKVIDWVLTQPYIIKELTITPEVKNE